MKLSKIKLGDYLKYISDYHANGSYKSLKQNIIFKRKKNYAVVIRTLNFERNDFHDDLIYIDEREYQYLSKSKVYPDDILMNKIANAGSVYIMPDLKVPVSCGMNLFLIRFKDSVNQRYMYYNMKNVEDYIKSFSHGTTTRTITKDEVKEIELIIHEKKDQDKIAHLLTNIDSKIANNNAISKELASMGKTIYDYWFLQFEFPDKDGKPYKSNGGKMVWNDQLKQEIPEGWEVSALKSILKENIKSKTKVNEALKTGKVPFFTSGETILFTDTPIVSGLNCYLNTGGNAGVKSFYGDASYSTDTWSLTADTNIKYLLPFIFKSLEPSMDKKFFQGTGLKHLQKNLLRNYIMAIPDQKTIDKFKMIVIDSFKQQSKIFNENQQLKSLRDFLLPLLMNGQVEIRD
ncbi:restriction endonuclease subunit S [Lactobacillus amylovorus]|nr:restriction endonuclease subunit S [Lactobacillus amylovorus]UIK35147.1 restriction endonuclease subunit S [Lactobacillus amylovorus]